MFEKVLSNRFCRNHILHNMCLHVNFQMIRHRNQHDVKFEILFAMTSKNVEEVEHLCRSQSVLGKPKYNYNAYCNQKRHMKSLYTFKERNEHILNNFHSIKVGIAMPLWPPI